MPEYSRNEISEERFPRRSDGKGVLLRLFGRNRRSGHTGKSQKIAQSADEVSSRMLVDANKMPLANFLMIAEENFGGYTSGRLSPKTDMGRSLHDGRFGSQSNKVQFSSPNLVARLMGLEPFPSFSCSAPQKDVHSDYRRKSVESLDVSSRSSDIGKLLRGESDKGKYAAEKELKAGKIRKTVSSGTAIQQSKGGYLTKRKDIFPRSSSASINESNSEFMELRQQLRERASVPLKKRIPNTRGEDWEGVTSMHLRRKSFSKVDEHLQTHKAHQRLVEPKEEIGQLFFTCRKCKSSVSPPMGKKPSDILSQFDSRLQHKTCLLEKNFFPSNGQVQDKAIGEKWSRSNFHSLKSSDNQYIPPRESDTSCNLSRMICNCSNNNEIVKESLSEESCFACARKPNDVYTVKSENVVPRQSNTSRNCDTSQMGTLFSTVKVVPHREASRFVEENSSQAKVSKHVESNNLVKRMDPEEVSSTYDVSKNNNTDILFLEKNGHRSCQDEPSYYNLCSYEKSPEFNIGNACCERFVNFFEDKVGAILEQKIRELKSLEQVDSDASDDENAHLSRSSASILEELISVLTNGQSVADRHLDDYECDHGIVDDPCDSFSPSSFAFCRESAFEMSLEEESPAFSDFSLETDCSGPSPVSTLETSFSSNSFISERKNMDSGKKLDPAFVKDSVSMLQLFDNDVNAAAINGREVARDRISHILDSISILYGTNPIEIGILENKPSYAREVISNSELLFDNVKLNKLNQKTLSSVDSFILDTLEGLVDAHHTSLCHLICPNTEERSGIRRFLFDFMIEYLDLKYGQLLGSGYKKRVNLTSFLTSENFARDISADVDKLIDSEGKVLCTLVSKEQEQLPANQRAYDSEVCEVGVEIGNELFQGLLNEILLGNL